MKRAQANVALTLATLAFAANFAVWILYAVVGLELQQSREISSTQLGVLFAAPILSGALLRIPTGVLVDRYNPKKCFVLQMLLVVPALLLLPFVDSFSSYLYLGLWIGISGTSFTIGLRYVNDWFERSQQGTAMGIFGAGNAGAAVTLLAAPFILEYAGFSAVGPYYAIGLAVTALIFALFAPTTNAANCRLDKASESVLKGNIWSVVHPLQVWRFGLYYYFVFGSFLALLLWLPQYYVNAYRMDNKGAMAFTLVFAASSSMVRALGGWFADRYGGRSVNWSVFWVCLVCLFFLSYPPTTMTIHGIEHDVQLQININVWLFSFLIFIIGIAQGFGRASVYKIIHDYYPNDMGRVGGFVAAIGALGGCTLPILFGLVEDIIGIHSASFMLLYGVLAACMIAMYLANKADRQQQRLHQALDHNFLEND